MYCECDESLNKERKYKKNVWSVDEDELLRLVVNEKGATDWENIAIQITGRSAKQCRERWCHHLDHNLRKGDWTKEEDAVILRMQKQDGNHWSKIAVVLKGRADIDVKNRFKKLQRDKIKLRKMLEFCRYGDRPAKAYSLNAPFDCTDDSLSTRSVQSSPESANTTPQSSSKHATTDDAVCVIMTDNCELLSLSSKLSTKRHISTLCDFEDIENVKRSKLFRNDVTTSVYIAKDDNDRSYLSFEAHSHFSDNVYYTVEQEILNCLASIDSI